MKKRVLMSLVLLTMIGASMVFAQDMFKYTAVQGGYSVAGALGNKATQGIITIPDNYNGKPVVAIDINGFKGYDRITFLVIPNSVIEIGNSAFQSCTGITETTMGEGVKTIGINAFRGCNKMRAFTSANIGRSVEKIRSSAFEGCSALERVWIRSSVTSIEDKAFYGCNSLTRVNFQHGQTVRIGASAFPGDLAEKYASTGAGPYDVTSRKTSSSKSAPVTWVKADS